MNHDHGAERRVKNKAQWTPPAATNFFLRVIDGLAWYMYSKAGIFLLE